VVYYLSYTTKRRPAPQIGYTMPTNTATTTKNDTAKVSEDSRALLKSHSDAISARMSATDPGPRMKATKAINRAELALWRAGVEFDPFIAPAKVSEKRFTMTPDELLTEIAELRAIAEDPNAPGRVRTVAKGDADRYVDQAKRRGIEVTDAA
jgi:hypothetical protein